MGRFDISPEVAEEYRGKFRDTVGAQVGGEVLAAGPFRTTGSGTKYGISKLQVGALAYGAAHMAGKKKAGGLPGQFLLAVTPDKLYALKYKSKRNGPEAKDVVAEWDRQGIKVETERLKTTTRVSLEFPGGDAIVCDQDGMGDNPWADDVVRELS
jgi:hypothetical protein